MPPFVPYYPKPDQPLDPAAALILIAVLLAIALLAMGASFWYSRRHEHHHPGHQH
jgi:Zn-dependent protease with chaperone function